MRTRIVSTVLLLLSMIAAGTSPLMAQAAEAEPRRAPFVERFINNQREIWTSPAKVNRSHVKWLVPIGVGAAVLMSQDIGLSNGAREAEGIRPASKTASNIGVAAMAIASGAFWGVGKLAGDSRASKTGLLAAEAIIHAELTVRGLKAIFNRERPNKFDGQGQFWGGGTSFPSGHASTSFAFATVVAGQYKHRPWIQVGAYGWATAVSLSRVGGLNHFPSDVLIGATVGHLIGRFVLKRHQDR